jgi:hypothetical protein
MASLTTQHAAGRAVLYNFLLNEVLASQIDSTYILYIVSPWIGNFALSDLYVSAFSELVECSEDRLHLFDVVRQIAANGQNVRLVTGPEERFLRPLLTLGDRTPRIAVRRHTALHAKLYAGARAAIRGSVNFTYSGFHHNVEAFDYYHDDQHVLETRQMCARFFDEAEEVR